MKKLILVLWCAVSSALLAPSWAQGVSGRGKIYLICDALTTSYTYTQLRGEIAGFLTEKGYSLSNSADDATWTIQVYGSAGGQKKSTIGSHSLYSQDVTVSIMIDRGAFAKRVYETTLKVSGKHTDDFDEAALDAYKRLTPQICDIIQQQIISPNTQ